MSTISEFDDMENKHTLYRGNIYEKILWTFKGTRKKCNWFWKQNNVTVNKEELKSDQDAKLCYICGNFMFQLKKSYKY